jgi:hypothetical protein
MKGQCRRTTLARLTQIRVAPAFEASSPRRKTSAAASSRPAAGPSSGGGSTGLSGWIGRRGPPDTDKSPRRARSGKKASCVSSERACLVDRCQAVPTSTNRCGHGGGASRTCPSSDRTQQAESRTRRSTEPVTSFTVPPRKLTKVTHPPFRKTLRAATQKITK